jgi:hypothetical protein
MSAALFAGGGRHRVALALAGRHRVPLVIDGTRSRSPVLAVKA